MDPNRIRAAIDGIYDEIIALRRDIHMHPELSQQEERTMHVISDRLAALNIPHETNVAGYRRASHPGRKRRSLCLKGSGRNACLRA